ncbi:MAG: hypothetical protein JJ850_03970 [Kordiimonadaceae bacterium]|nr:hypothetical protein [Kordiimonadaceae bacterium]MBO6568525.1 hypothetical protein [Kordiimonadaceae bacterium]MBO6963746.1 hypothetical protein [Kordiimonadaceae bacterium]
MVDINTSASALQAQLQASQQGRVTGRAPAGTSQNSNANTPQNVISQRIDARQDLPTPDRRTPVRQSASSNELSSSAEIEDASRRVADLTGNRREAPAGRISNAPAEERDQPLGQIVNILV